MYHNKRNRIIAAIIAGILVVLMLGSTIFGALSMAAAASKSQLNNKLAEIKTQKAEVERQLAAYQKDKEAYAGQIGTLNNKINLTEQQIAATEEVIQELTRSIAETNEELAKAEEKLAEKQALFETRIRVMYENGETSYMEVLLNSDSFSDMLSNMEIVSQIMEYDKNVVTEVQQMRDSIEQMKEKLESDHKQQKEHKDSLEAGKHELEADKAKLKTMMEQVESNMDSARWQPRWTRSGNKSTRKLQSCPVGRQRLRASGHRKKKERRHSRIHQAAIQRSFQVGRCGGLVRIIATSARSSVRVYTRLPGNGSPDTRGLILHRVRETRFLRQSPAQWSKVICHRLMAIMSW